MKDKRTLLLIIIFFSLAILLFPIRIVYKDGGSANYRAIMYSITDYHTIDGNTGVLVKILGFKVYDSTTFKISK